MSNDLVAKLNVCFQVYPPLRPPFATVRNRETDEQIAARSGPYMPRLTPAEIAKLTIIFEREPAWQSCPLHLVADLEAPRINLCAIPRSRIIIEPGSVATFCDRRDGSCVQGVGILAFSRCWVVHTVENGRLTQQYRRLPKAYFCQLVA